MTTALELTGVSRSFGQIHAVDNVSFQLARGARHALIGPNGAGKSTLFNLIAGTVRLSAGQITFHGQNITTAPEHKRAGMGIARTFQHSQLFLNETVIENVLLATFRKHRVSWAFGKTVSSYRRHNATAYELLDRVGLADKAPENAGALSHGERRQLEIAVALAVEPTLLLMDEPVAGISAAETASFLQVVNDLPSDVSVLLVEHDLDVVLSFASAVTVLHLGQHLITGSPDQVRASPAAQDAYLGAAASSGRLDSSSAWTAEQP